LGFFDLPPNYNVYLHLEIFRLVHHGGFSHRDVYNMPKHLRSFYNNKLNSENKQIDEGLSSDPNVSSPLNKDGTIKK